MFSYSTQSLAKVFAGMSDGLVAVYTLVDDFPLDGEMYLCSHTLNKTVFGLKDFDSRQRPYPVQSMALLSSGSQVTMKPHFPSSSWFRSQSSSYSLCFPLLELKCWFVVCVFQLWFSNGPGLLVIDTSSLQAVRRLEPYKVPSSIVSLTTSFSLCGEEAVWTLDDHSNTLKLYYAASYELCATYW